MTQIKICGITNLNDARVAVGAGADLLGFIFYKPSPRYVAPEAVREIVAEVRGSEFRVRGLEFGVQSSEFGVQSSEADMKAEGQESAEVEENNHSSFGTRRSSLLFVGVFVNTPLPDVEQILDFCELDAAQLHGNESPEFVAHFNGRAYKALRPQSLQEAKDLVTRYAASQEQQPTINQSPSRPISQSPPLPALLIDAYHPNLYGGTGRVTDWTMAATIARQHPIMLAGSLTPHNVAEAIRAVQPWGVDVSSGVEAEKGRKDHGKVRAFIERVRNHEAR